MEKRPCLLLGVVAFEKEPSGHLRQQSPTLLLFICIQVIILFNKSLLLPGFK